MIDLDECPCSGRNLDRLLARWHATLEEYATALGKLLAMMREALSVREETPEGGSDVRE